MHKQTDSFVFPEAVFQIIVLPLKIHIVSSKKFYLVKIFLFVCPILLHYTAFSISQCILNYLAYIQTPDIEVLVHILYAYFFFRKFELIADYILLPIRLYQHLKFYFLSIPQWLLHTFCQINIPVFPYFEFQKNSCISADTPLFPA